VVTLTFLANPLCFAGRVVEEAEEADEEGEDCCSVRARLLNDEENDPTVADDEEADEDELEELEGVGAFRLSGF
jgi:hypothetical protein